MRNESSGFLLTLLSLLFMDLGLAAHSQECLRTFKGHKLPIVALVISPDGKTLASGDSYVEKPGEVKLWELSTGRELLTFRKHTQAISGLAFSFDGKKLAS